VIVKHTGYLT